MHARQSVTSLRETDPAGNSEKSGTSRACFAFDDFALLDAPAFAAALDAPAAFAFVTPEAFAFDAAAAFNFDAFVAAAFLPAAFFTVAAAAFALAAGFVFFAAAFDLVFVAAI
jgi:hypothetical protein